VSNLYKPLPFTFMPFRIMVFVLMFLLKHVLGKKFRLNLEYIMASTDSKFFLMFGT